MKLKHSQTENRHTNYRTWKKGKTWLYGCSVAATLVAGALFTGQTVNADVAPENTTVLNEANNTALELQSEADNEIISSSEILPEENIIEINSETSETAVFSEAKTETSSFSASLTSTEPTIAVSEITSASESSAADSDTIKEAKTTEAEKENTPLMAPQLTAAAADKADITDLNVIFTDEKIDTSQPLSDGDEIPIGSSGTRSVGGEISFSLDTTGYSAGESITIPRTLLANGESNTSCLPGISSYDVKDGAGNILGTIKAAAGGNIIFTLSETAVKTSLLEVKTTIPTLLSSFQRFADVAYQLTIGDKPIDLNIAGNHNQAMISSSDKSTDGTAQRTDGATQNEVRYAVVDEYPGHINQQQSLDGADYDNTASGIISNISDTKNTITKVTVKKNSRFVSYWSEGKQYWIGGINLIGNDNIISDSFLSGVDNSIFKDASSKLNATMTPQQAEAALEPGEWGSVDLGDGSWLWAYKTGDPSAGTILDGDGYIAALKAAGVKMTAEDEAKTKEQSQFVARQQNEVVVTFADNSINGTARNTMGTGSVVDNSTLIPGAESSGTRRITITYIDEVTGQPLGGVEQDTGLPGTDSSKLSPEETIKKYEEMGYVHDSAKDTLPSGNLTFGPITDPAQDYIVYFTHGTKESKETEEVTRTIHYVDENGKTVAPDSVKTVTFERTVTTDLVDDKLSTTSDWTPASGDFAEVTSPILENYSDPSIPVVEAVTGVAPDAKDIVETVVYTAKTEAVTDTKTVDQVIHYVYEDGTEAAPDSTDSVHFTRTGSKNLATGDIAWNEWTADNDDTTIDGVESPTIEGYTADILTADARTGLTADSEPSEITVTYKKNPAEPAPPVDKPEPPTEEPETPVSTAKPGLPEILPAGNPVQPVTVTAQQETSKTAQLPSTGEEKTVAAVVGAALVTSAAILILLSRLKKNKQ
jgi:LPXTG-motif cell wall-anchored protein